MKAPRHATLLLAMIAAMCLPLLWIACSGGHSGPPANTISNTQSKLAQTPEASPEPTHQQRRYSLSEAIDNKFANAMICGLGASSGEAVIMAISSALADPMEITLDEGATLRSSDSEAQDMVLDSVAKESSDETTKEIAKACTEAAEREERRLKNDQDISEGWKKINLISIPGFETRVYIVRAYCLDFEKGNPSAKTRFSLSNDANSETKMVFKYLRQNPAAFKASAIQLATWAINGDLDPDEIAEKFPFDESERVDACSLLKRAGVSSAGKKLCAN